MTLKTRTYVCTGKTRCGKPCERPAAPTGRGPSHRAEGLLKPTTTLCGAQSWVPLDRRDENGKRSRFLVESTCKLPVRAEYSEVEHGCMRHVSDFEKLRRWSPRAGFGTKLRNLTDNSQGLLPSLPCYADLSQRPSAIERPEGYHELCHRLTPGGFTCYKHARGKSVTELATEIAGGFNQVWRRGEFSWELDHPLLRPLRGVRPKKARTPVREFVYVQVELIYRAKFLQEAGALPLDWQLRPWSRQANSRDLANNGRYKKEES